MVMKGFVEKHLSKKGKRWGGEPWGYPNILGKIILSRGNRRAENVACMFKDQQGQWGQSCEEGADATGTLVYTLSIKKGFEQRNDTRSPDMTTFKIFIKHICIFLSLLPPSLSKPPPSRAERFENLMSGIHIWLPPQNCSLWSNHSNLWNV